MSYSQGGQFDQEQVPELAKVNGEPSQDLQGTTLGLRPNNSIKTIHAASFFVLFP